MQHKMAKKIFSAVLSVSLIFQLGMTTVYAEESNLPQETKTITAFAELAENVRSITVPIGTEQTEVLEKLPNTLVAECKQMTTDTVISVNLQGITWESNEAFSSQTEKEFIFTAKLADASYTLAEGVKMPSITVKVVKQSALLMSQPADMVLIDGATNGGDITQTGLLLNEGLPDKMTQYKAGNGYVLFTPASQSANGKATIELNNAAISTEQVNAIRLPGGDIDLVLKGNNELKSNANWVYGTIAGVNTKLFVTGDGTLSAKETENADLIGYGIYLEGTSSFACDSSAALRLNLATYTEYGDNKAQQEVFGSVTLRGRFREDADLIIHNDAQLTLQRPDGLGEEYVNSLIKDLSIGQNAKLVIEDGVEFGLDEWNGHLPVVTNDGGEIIVKGVFFMYDSSYLKDLAKLNIITEGKGKVLFQEQPIDAVSGKYKFDDSLGIRLSRDNGGEYSCGQGTMKWEPVTGEVGNLIGGTLTLNNADILMKDNNKGAITVYEGKSVPITLKLEGNNSIENPYGTAIDIADLTLTGSGALTAKGENSIVYETKFDTDQFSGKLSAFVLKVAYDPSYGRLWYGTAYGTVSYTGGEFCQSLTVEKDAELTIEAGSELNANTLTNNGTIINNGTLSIQRDAGDNELKNWVYDSLNLKGNGIVKVRQQGGSAYALFTNDGELINRTIDTPLDFSHATADQGDLTKDGYHWDNQTQKLTLKNFIMWGNPSSDGTTAISLPEGNDVTLELKGYNKITGFKNAVYQGKVSLMEEALPVAKGSLTVVGDGTLMTENQTYNQTYSEEILTTTGKLIVESGNLLIASAEKGGTGITAVGMEIKGGSIGSESISAPISSLGDFTMSGGKVISKQGDWASLGVMGNLTLTGGELITGSGGGASIGVQCGDVRISGGKLTAHNNEYKPTGGILLRIDKDKDQKLSITGGTVDIKAGASAIAFMAYPGATGKGILETSGMTVTTNPKGGTLKAAVISIEEPGMSGQVTAYALTAEDSLKVGKQGFLNACTSFTAVKAPPKPSDGGNSNSGSTSGGTSGGGGGGAVNSGNAAITVSTPANNTNASTKATAVVNTEVINGTLQVTATQSTVTEAIKKAQEEAKKNGTEKKGITVEIKADAKNNAAENLSANLPKASVDELVRQQVTELGINTGSVKMNLNLETLKAIQEQVGSDVTLSAKKVDNNTLSAEAKAAVGNHPVYDFTITGTNGQKVTQFGKGKITVSLPYVLGENEKAENVTAYYIDNEGKIHEVQNAFYDEKTKSIVFETDHFSKYAVGYKANVGADTSKAGAASANTTSEALTAFTDISNHWAKGDIAFVTARGLFGGTASGKFSPNMPMTRGMFVTVLARLAKADVSSYQESSFKDVNAKAYYMPAVEWASKNGIVSGTANNGFAPDEAITREQMAVIMANYAKKAGLKLSQAQAENNFADSTKISSYAKSAVGQMQMAGILGGKNGNKFEPQGTATRAEVSAVIKRFVEFTEK